MSAPGKRFGDSVRQIAPLAWPVFIGQVSVLAFNTIDTVLVARTSASDLAALAVGASVYTSIFVGFMGVLLALSPIVGQLQGAGRLHEAGAQAHQSVWLALVLAALGCTLLLFPAPFLAWSQATPEVADKVRTYLAMLAFSLPAALLFTIYRAFNTAVSRPKAVMVLQVSALGLKLPLTWALVSGVPALGLAPMGVVGCGIATAVAMWAQVLVGWWWLRRDDSYAVYGLFGRGLDQPSTGALREQLRLGLPLGGSILVEVTGFTFMALFIARLGTTPVAGHQIAVNLVSMMFMVPLGVANATTTLVAQQLGAGHGAAARRLGWHGLWLGWLLAGVLGALVFGLREPVLGLYTQDAAVIAAAMPLLAWLALFHLADATQTIAAFVLRAYKVATVPMVIYVVALWGVGLGGGQFLAFGAAPAVPAAWQGAPGFWVASTAGLLVAATGMVLFLRWRSAQAD